MHHAEPQSEFHETVDRYINPKLKALVAATASAMGSLIVLPSLGSRLYECISCSSKTDNSALRQAPEYRKVVDLLFKLENEVVLANP